MSKEKLGSIEMNFLSWAQMRSKTVLKTGEAAKALGLMPRQEERLLSRLSLSGLITRLIPGLYLIPTKLPPGGRWSPDEVLVISELMKHYGGVYQITGLRAFNRYGFSTQIPNLLTIYNDKISGKRKIAGMRYDFVKVPENRLGGTVSTGEKDGALKLVYPTVGRTLLDAVYDWSRFNTLPRAYEWITEKVKNRKVVEELVDSALRFGNIATMRRLGYCLEAASADKKSIGKILKALKPTKSCIGYVPTKPIRGKIIQKWGIVDNV